MSTFDPDSYAAEQGFNKAVVNDNGSITVTMTKARHKEVLNEMVKSIEENFADTMREDGNSYIAEIKHSASFDSVDVFVEKTGYENAGLSALFIPLMIYIQAAYYQAFANEDQHCEIKIIYVDTDDVIGSVTYPDAWND